MENSNMGLRFDRSLCILRQAAVKAPGAEQSHGADNIPRERRSSRRLGAVLRVLVFLASSM